MRVFLRTARPLWMTASVLPTVTQSCLRRRSRCVKAVQNSVTSSREQLEVLSRELQQRFNQLYVVVPLRLHQIELESGGAAPWDLSQAVVLTREVVPGLRSRVLELQAETQCERERYRLARRQHALLLSQCTQMEARLHEAEQRCKLVQKQRFGGPGDLEALPVLLANMNLQQAKGRLDAHLRQVDHTKHAKQQKAKRGHIDSQRLREDLGRLRRLVKTQQQEAEAIKREIHILSRKGGPALPPHQVAPAPVLLLPSLPGNRPRAALYRPIRGDLKEGKCVKKHEEN
ncbi:hypothetical protein NHX12_021064 [Muraenolepis orangiensis]|uniref:Uncharacterized protein n=1 Tax=Muraenolepis orangiensis TaxID=630683 RepID=A0A9Q0ERG8_9TELE|nr:hypothetical protein NHX12_021064 [Muraenolepis orangiensis]